MDDSSVLQNDLAEFCRLVGHFDGAQPKSPHEVFQECLARVKEMRARLAPFAAEKLPSSKKTEIAYNRHGLRCCMSPLEIAKDAAYAALNPPSSIKNG